MNKNDVFPFNEVSLKSLNNSRQVKAYLERINLFNTIINNDEPLKIAYHSNVLKQSCADGQTFLDHIEKAEIDNDMLGLLYSTITDSPFLEQLQQNVLEHELYYDNENHIGAAYAYHFNQAILSIPSGNKWDNFNLKMIKHTYDTSGDNIIQSEVDVNNLGCLDSIDIENTWVRDLIEITQLDTPTELLELIEKNCPNVVISDSAQNYINKLGGNISILNNIYNSCKILEEYCATKWHSGGIRRTHISSLGLTIKNESNVTMDKFGEERKFKNSNEETETYRFHFNITNDTRGYIGSMPNERKIYIAYLGAHLRTVKFD